MTKELTNDDYDAIVFGDHKDYATINCPRITDNSRWELYYEAVVQEIKTGTFWRLTWERGATEYQDTEPRYKMVQVFPKEKRVTVYETAK